jgi:CheY-like chemotaxis protein
MGSHIELKSTYNKGSNFSFEVDFKIAKTVKDMKNEDIYLDAGISLNILVAEDNEVNLMVISKMLTRIGHRFDHAADGQIALDLVLKNNYDLVLMDVQMPVMDGIQATRKIREKEIDIPIIALTANAFREDRERCISSGMNEFLTKPLKLIDLKNLLDQFTG